MKVPAVCICGGLIAAGAVNARAQQEPVVRWYGGVTFVSLHADDGRISEGQTLSADVFAELQSTNGRWLFYLEGNSSLGAQDVSWVFPDANADAATAIDPDGGGRIQLSEINYRFSGSNGGGLTVGLVDPTAYLDRGRITNDENVQFLGTSFVNNATIEFPDYTLGLVYERPRIANIPQFNFVFTRARGLADNSNLSYSDLVQFDEDDDGVFAAVGFGWPSERRLFRSGVWINTKRHRALVGASNNRDNYGAYLVYGHTMDRQALSVRTGISNDAVSSAAGFMAFAYRYRWRQHALGAGVSHTVLSGEIRDSGLDDSTSLEIFGRFTIGSKVHLTASLQRLLHASFIAVDSDPRNAANLAGLRVHYAF